MKICVFGAGAVGGMLAARLRLAGEDVSVVARGAHADAIRERGLTLLSGGSRQCAPVQCVSDPTTLGAQDVVFVTVKAHQVSAIADDLARMLRQGSRVVFAMNGLSWWFLDGLPVALPASVGDLLDPGRLLRRTVPLQRVIGAVVQSSNEVIEPGVILNTTPDRNRMTLGNAEAGQDNDLGAIAAILHRAGYSAVVTPDTRRELWNKMVLWLAVAPTAALTGRALDVLVSDPDAKRLMAGVMQEAAELGRRLGFDLPDDHDERLEFYRSKPTRPSLLVDFERGRPPELAHGVLIFAAIAQALEMPAPYIETIATLVRMKAGGG